MPRALSSFSAALALCLVATVGPADARPIDRQASARPDTHAKPHAKGNGHPPMMLGPGDAKVHDVGGKAIIRMSKWGYVYITGQQNNHLRVTFVEKLNALRFRDTGGTHTFGSMVKTCKREKVKRGVSAICTIPKRFDQEKKFVQVWPRLGNDYVDGRTLPKQFRLWVLADAGRDVVYGGDGDDFVNAAFDNDRAYGGKGNDFLRGGPGADHMVGGPGRDRIS